MNAAKLSPYVALLRGVNLGKRNKLPMAWLKLALAELGCVDVRTYIASGNAVFRASSSLAKELSALLRARIEADHGFDSPVIVLSKRQLATVVRDNPLLEPHGPEKLSVAFLAKRPTKARVDGLDLTRGAPDAFAVKGRAVYLYLPNGSHATKLSNAYWERALATDSTVRNWRTVLKLHELAGETA